MGFWSHYLAHEAASGTITFTVGKEKQTVNRIIDISPKHQKEVYNYFKYFCEKTLGNLNILEEDIPKKCVLKFKSSEGKGKITFLLEPINEKLELTIKTKTKGLNVKEYVEALVKNLHELL